MQIKKNNNRNNKTKMYLRKLMLKNLVRIVKMNLYSRSYSDSKLPVKAPMQHRIFRPLSSTTSLCAV